MTTHRLPTRTILLAAAAALFLALPAAAARRTDDALSLVPADAAAVAVIHWNTLRASPLGAKLFSETDHLTCDGDAALFMAEARLNPTEDVDVIVIAASPAAAGQGEASGLVLFEGRFDTNRLSAALAARGGTRRATPNGDYFLLPDKSESRQGKAGAVAFASAHLVIAGDEAAVVAALARRASGGSDFASRTVLGRHFSRIGGDASAWALVDVKRFPMRRASEKSAGEAGEVLSAMKAVSSVAMQATVKGDSVEVAAAGVAADDETRQLLEDSIRGILAMWRLAVQEKSPEAVAMLRRFKVGNDGQAVTVKGTLTGDFLRSLSDKRAVK